MILSEEIIGVLYEQNKSNETMQRHESDTTIDPVSIWDSDWFMVHI